MLFIWPNILSKIYILGFHLYLFVNHGLVRCLEDYWPFSSECLLIPDIIIALLFTQSFTWQVGLNLGCYALHFHEPRSPGEGSEHSRAPKRVCVGMLFQTLVCYDVIHLGNLASLS